MTNPQQRVSKLWIYDLRTNMHCYNYWQWKQGAEMGIIHLWLNDHLTLGNKNQSKREKMSRSTVEENLAVDVPGRDAAFLQPCADFVDHAFETAAIVVGAGFAL